MKNKEYIRAAAFITSLLILLVLMFCGFTVFADDPTTIDYVSHFNITDVYDVDDFDLSYENKFLFATNRSELTTYRNKLASNPSTIDIDYILDQKVSAYSSYIWTSDQFVPCSSDSFLLVGKNTGGNHIYYRLPDNILDLISADPTQSVKKSYISSLFVAYSKNQNIISSNVIMVDGKPYMRIGYYEQMLLSSNCPVYAVDDSSSVINSIDGLENVNPYYTPQNVENSSNNLYLEDAYFLWTTFDPVNDNIIGDNFNIDNIYNSFVTFNYQLTPYQKEHLNDFTINVKASISYSMKFTGHSDYKNWSGSYLYEAPLSQFNTGSLKYNFTDIFNSTGFTSYFNNNYQGEIDFSNSSFKLTMDAELVDNKGGTSSDYIDIFDFLNNKVRNQSKAITNNNNPYVPTDSGDPIQSNAQVPTVQTGDGVVPTGNNSVSSSGSGTVNVVQNNNTGLVNPKPVTDMVKNELLPNENDTNFVGLLAEQTHEDGFVSLMSTTFSFVPVTVWTSLSHYFNIFLTMLVAFFALRLILDIL